jgi:hypothetical protein
MAGSMAVRMSCIFSCAVFTKDSARDDHFHDIQQSHHQTQKTHKKDRCLDLATVERVSTFPNTRLSFKIKGDIGFRIEQIYQCRVLTLNGLFETYHNEENARKYLSKKYLKKHQRKKHEPFIFR